VRNRTRAASVALLIVGLTACSSGGSASTTGPKTDAEWGRQAQPVANRILASYNAIDDQVNAGEGMKPIQQKCRQLNDAVTAARRLPPLPSGSEATHHFKSGLSKISKGAVACANGTADDLVHSITQVEAGFEEIRTGVGAFDLG
jgi:hypothetical protein